MADFGINATQLQQAQGAGSAPVAPVQEQASSWSLPNLGGLFSGINTKPSDEKPWAPAVNEYYKKLTGIQQAASTGGLSARAAANQSRMLGIEYAQKVADFGIEAHKALQDSRSYAAGLTIGVEEMDTIQKKDLEQNYDIAKGLIDKGVYIPPVGEQTQADRDMLSRQAAHLNNMERIGKEAREAAVEERANTAEGRATKKFNWDMREQARMQDAQNSLAAMKKDSLNYIPTLIENINKQNIPQAEKLALFEQSIGGLTAVASDLLIGDAASLSNYQGVIKGVADIGRETFKDGADVTKLQSELQKRLIGAQLSLLDRGGAPASEAAAADRLFPNVPAVTMAASTGLLTVYKNDLVNAASGRVVPSVLTNDIPTQRNTFETIKGTINASTISGNTDDLDAAAKASSAVLRSLGSVSASNPVSLEYTADFVASPEFGELIKAGKFDADAADSARPAFQDLYINAVGKQFKNNLGRPVGDITYSQGAPSGDNRTLGQMIDFEISPDGKLKAVNALTPEERKEITASDLYINRQVREAQTLAAGLEKTLRAAAHLDGRTDYATYWEENRHVLAQGLYVPPWAMDEFVQETGYIGTGSTLNKRNYKSNDRASPTED